MNLLITGGCGFLGSNIAAAYSQEGARVTIIDNMRRVGSRYNQSWLEGLFRSSGNLKMREGDLTEIEFLEEVFTNHGPFDYICHLSGQVAMTKSLLDPLADFRNNTLGTLNLLDVARRMSPDTVIAFSSTNKVYGDLRFLHYGETSTRYFLSEFPNGIDEKMPLDFSSPYGCSKGAADQYVRDWFRSFGVKTVVFRHSSIYGGRQFATIDQGWVGWFTKNAIEHKSHINKEYGAVAFEVSGTGKQVRDILHSSDLVRLYRMAFEKRESIAGEVFNIGGGMPNSLSLIELCQELYRLLGMAKEPIFKYLPRRHSDQDVFVADISKAKDLIGWEPQVHYSEGIEQMIQWVQEI
ncbi:MAG: GDP-mannose 4,6-dehydratase [Planctomycetaceae bacterium]|jgi:CDP-paratose 2-epimerase|nr:GDP-mannose 4,6-dehydratase [Planctomycetaceae bacterium]